MLGIHRTSIDRVRAGDSPHTPRTRAPHTRRVLSCREQRVPGLHRHAVLPNADSHHTATGNALPPGLQLLLRALQLHTLRLDAAGTAPSPADQIHQDAHARRDLLRRSPSAPCRIDLLAHHAPHVPVLAHHPAGARDDPVGPARVDALRVPPAQHQRQLRLRAVGRGDRAAAVVVDVSGTALLDVPVARETSGRHVDHPGVAPGVAGVANAEVLVAPVAGNGIAG